MTETPEAPEVQKESKQIRTLNDSLGVLGSGTTDGFDNEDAMGKPRLYTNWGDDESVYTNPTAAPVDNIHDAWWLEDFYKKSDVGSLTSLDGRRTLKTSEMGGGHVGVVNTIFRAKAGGGASPTIEGDEFNRVLPGCLQMGSKEAGLVSVIMGCVPGKTSNLSSRKALFSCPLGMTLTMNSAGSETESVTQAFRFKHLSILYKKDNEAIKYGAIVENYQWRNKDRTGLLSNFDTSQGGFDPTEWFGKNEIGPGWTTKPLLGGSLYSFISEDEISVLESNVGYKAVGMIMTWDVAANHAVNIYDLCPIFATGEIPNTKSRRIIQPPMLFSESLNVKSYRMV